MHSCQNKRGRDEKNRRTQRERHKKREAKNLASQRGAFLRNAQAGAGFLGVSPPEARPEKGKWLFRLSRGEQGRFPHDEGTGDNHRGCIDARARNFPQKLGHGGGGHSGDIHAVACQGGTAGGGKVRGELTGGR